MELIVKIGADQAKLNETITRMKSQFQNMNVSMPTSWGGTARGALAQMPPPIAGGGFIADQGAKAMTSMTGMLRGMLIGQLSGLAIEVADKASVWFWEKIYGVSPEATAKIAASHAKIISVIGAKEASKASRAKTERESILENASPEARKAMLLAEKNQADANVAKSRSAVDVAKRAYDDAKAGTAIGTSGEKLNLTPMERRQYTLALAEAETRLNKAREDQIKATDEYMKSVQAVTDKDRTEALAKADKEREARLEKANLTMSEMGITKASPFGADAMAQAGLFAGSSLLMNPAMNLQQQQVTLLREISSKIGQNPFVQ